MYGEGIREPFAESGASRSVFKVSPRSPRRVEAGREIEVTLIIPSIEQPDHMLSGRLKSQCKGIGCYCFFGGLKGSRKRKLSKVRQYFTGTPPLHGQQFPVPESQERRGRCGAPRDIHPLPTERRKFRKEERRCSNRPCLRRTKKSSGLYQRSPADPITKRYSIFEL